MSPAGERAVAPDAARVWRGFRSPAMAPDAFFDRLGAVFVPATVELQVAAGLCAYVPTVPAALPGKPDTVPDETAVLFWESQQTYADGFKRLAVRTYTLTHAAVYAPGSGADFPVPFTGELAAEQPVHLVDRPADWMAGPVVHLVGGRGDDIGPAAFRDRVAAELAAVQRAGAVAGAIACAGDDYLVYWALGGAGGGGAEDGAEDGVERLAACCGWSQVVVPRPTRLEAGLWDEWPGMAVGTGDSFNMQFERRGER